MGEKYKTLDELFLHYGEEGVDAKDFRDSLNKTMGETHVPKEVFNKLNDNYNSYKAEAEQWKESVGKVDEWKSKYEALESTSKQLEEKYKTDLASVKRDFAIENVLASAKPHDVKALKAMLDMGKVSFDDEGLHGLNEQLESLQKDKSWLFEKNAPHIFTDGKEHNNDNDSFNDELRKVMLGY